MLMPRLPTPVGIDHSVNAPVDDEDSIDRARMMAAMSLPDAVDAVVSLRRVSDTDLPAHAQQIGVRLMDRGRTANDDGGCHVVRELLWQTSAYAGPPG